MLTLGQALLLLSSITIITLFFGSLGMVLIYRLCLRHSDMVHTVMEDYSSVLTELLASKTFAETGNQRIATNILKHSTLHQSDKVIASPTPEMDEDLAPGPGVGDDLLVGEDQTIVVGGERPPLGIEEIQDQRR